MQNNQSNSIVLLRSDFASIFTSPPSLIDSAPQTQLCSWLSASFYKRTYVIRMHKQLSLLYDWHLQNVRQTKYLFSAILVGTNNDRDVINELCPKATITWKSFACVWQQDQYHYLFQIQSNLFVRTPINRNPRYPQWIARNRFLPLHFTLLIRKPRWPTPTRNLGTDMSYH